MLHPPTIIEIENKILEIFSQFNIRPNQNLPVRSILGAWMKTGYNNEELANGLESLIKKNVIEETDKQSFRLCEVKNMHNLEGNWVGIISGTNNGDVFVEMRQNNETLSGITRINDKVFGTTVYHFTGKVDGNDIVMEMKPQEKQKLSSAAVYVNNRPVTIQVPTTNFGDVVANGIIKDDTITGKWTSSIGTGGTFEIARGDKVAINNAKTAERQLNRSFVMMPIDMTKPELVDVLNTIKRAAKKFDIECFRADEVEHSEKITDIILEFINTSKYLICDISSERPNVYYELGYAHGRNKKVILIARQGSNIHFDIKDYNIIFYENMTELEKRLIKRLNAMQNEK